MVSLNVVLAWPLLSLSEAFFFFVQVVSMWTVCRGSKVCLDFPPLLDCGDPSFLLLKFRSPIKAIYFRTCDPCGCYLLLLVSVTCYWTHKHFDYFLWQAQYSFLYCFLHPPYGNSKMMMFHIPWILEHEPIFLLLNFLSSCDISSHNL